MAGLKANIAGIDWRSEDVGRFAGMDFFFDTAFSAAPPPGQVLVLKPRVFLDRYAEVLDGAPTKRVFDLGIWQGGSALAFAALMDVDRLVCLDICDPILEFDATRAAHPDIGERIAVHYNTSQDDAARIDAICRSEFGGAPLDLVIDDASHHYALSKRSFEILFPKLRPGGWYVIEDWGWAHGPFVIWPEEPSLASLVFKLQLAWLCRPDLISRIVVQREMVFIQKAEGAPVGGAIDVDELFELHHRKFPLIA